MQKKSFHYEFYSALNQRLIDALIAGIAFYLSYQIRFEGNVPPSNLYQMWLLLPGVMLGRVLVSSLLGTYRLIWRYISLTDARIVVRGLVAFSVILLVLRLTPLPDPWGVLRAPLSIIVIEFLLTLTADLSARALRRILYQRHLGKTFRGAQRSRILLVGAGSSGAMVVKEIASRPDVKVVGFLDDDPKKIGSVVNGVRVLGPTTCLPSLAKEHRIDQVIVCITRPSRAVVKRLWALCDHLAVQTKIVPTVEEILHSRVSVANFRDLDMADLLGRETLDVSPKNEAEVSAVYRGKRILITGAGGSIGSELAHQLLRFSPEQLILLDKDENGLFELCSGLGVDFKKETIYPVVADIRFQERIEAIVSRFRPAIIFHAAAHKHVPLMELNPCEAVLNNVVGTSSLVEACRTFGVSRFVLISTDKAVRPTSIMGASKRLCEMIVQAGCSRDSNGRSHFTCVRFGNVMGSRGSVIPLFQKQIARGGPVTVTHPDVQRFLMTIPEAVSLVIQAGALGSSGEIFVLDMGDPVHILDLAHDLIELSGLVPGRDIQIEMTQLRPGEKIREELIDSERETLARTRYEKIFVVRGQPFDLAAFARRLVELADAARRESLQEIYRILRELNIGFDPEASWQRSSRAAAAKPVRAQN